MNGIHRVEGVCGGRPVIEGTRIEPHIILTFFLAGHSLAQIAAEYPSLTPEQIEDGLRFECCKACRCAECAWARELARNPKPAPKPPVTLEIHKKRSP